MFLIHTHDVFDRHITLDRLSLTNAFSINEVYIDIYNNCKHALVIQDFHTGAPINLLLSRRTNAMAPYFTSIPAKTFRSKISYFRYIFLTSHI